MSPSYKVSTSNGRSRTSLEDHSVHNRSFVDHGGSISSILPFVSSTINSCDLNNVSIEDDTNSNYTVGLPVTRSRRNSFDALLLTSAIDRLPFEIRLKIACYLDQYDALNLMKVNKSFFESTVARLYHAVVVDPEYSQFNHDINQSGRENSDQTINAFTYIKMSYSLKTFLRSLSQNLPLGSFQTSTGASCYGSLINKLYVVELPDGFNSPFDLNQFTYTTVQKLERLNEFIWDSSEELCFDIIGKLPNKHKVTSLFANVDIRRIASTEYRTFEGFKNLERLSLEPFLNSSNLFQIFKSILEGNDGVLGLNSLRIAKYNSNYNFIKNIPSSSLVLTDYILDTDKIKLSDYDMHCILKLFILFGSYDTRLESLRSFALDSIVVSTMDAKRLQSFMDLSMLTHLELRNITEVQFPEDINSPMTMNELHSKLDHGFLKSLGNKLKNLKRLSIDYREGLRDTVPSFINMLDGLEELDVTIRWNVTKLCTLHTWKQLCFIYVKAIRKHSSTLKKLSLDTKEDSVFCELHKLIFTDCLLELCDLKQLVSLRLHGYSLQPCAPLLVFCLPNLKFFEIFGSGASGTPHMGLQPVHQGVLDDSLRHHHVALAINKSNPSIKFIKIDKCIFEVKNNGQIVPKDGISRWFDEKVRVKIDRF